MKSAKASLQKKRPKKDFTDPAQNPLAADPGIRKVVAGLTRIIRQGNPDASPDAVWKFVIRSRKANLKKAGRKSNRKS